jgi:hypothetical protein
MPTDVSRHANASFIRRSTSGSSNRNYPRAGETRRAFPAFAT